MSRVERVSILVPCYGKPIRVKADKAEEISNWVKQGEYDIFQEMPKYERESMVCLFAYLPNTSVQWKIVNNILNQCECRVYVNEDGKYCNQNMALMYKCGITQENTPVFGDVIIRTTRKQLEKRGCFVDTLAGMPYAETRDEIEKSKELRMYMFGTDDSDIEESDKE
jgi:hypothetical protein